MSKKQTYKEALNELQEILQEIQGPNIDIDLLAKKVKRASELIKWCKEKLTSADEEIKNILDE